MSINSQFPLCDSSLTPNACINLSFLDGIKSTDTCSQAVHKNSNME